MVQAEFPSVRPELFADDELDFQQAVRGFLQAELEPNAEALAKGDVPVRMLWDRAATAGLLGYRLPVELGGAPNSALFGVVMSYELGRTLGYAVVGSTLTSDMATALLEHAPELLRKEMAGRILGGAIQAMALTEPDAGTNSAAIRTTARRDGEDFVLNGSKTFISMADVADIIYVVAKTDPDAGFRGMSIFAVESDVAGLVRSRVEMLGMPTTGLGELSFDDVRVPSSRLIGPLHGAIPILAKFLTLDRVGTSARALAQAELALDLTVRYTKERIVAGGMQLFTMQNTQIELAEAEIEVRAARFLLRETVALMRRGELSNDAAAACKVFVTDVTTRTVDRCVQLHGAAGIAMESPIARIYAAHRKFRILAGTSELLKLAVAKTL